MGSVCVSRQLCAQSGDGAVFESRPFIGRLPAESRDFLSLCLCVKEKDPRVLNEEKLAHRTKSEAVLQVSISFHAI